MDIQFTFKHMLSSQALSDLAAEKLSARIKRFTSRPVHTHVTFSLDGLHQKIHVSLITADGHNIEAEHSGDDMYVEIDVIAEKVEVQLRKHKERLKEFSGEGLKGISRNLANSRSTSEEPLDTIADDAIDAGDILNFHSNTHPPLAPICGP